MRSFWAGRKSPILGVWAAPAAPTTLPTSGGFRPPPFAMVFGAAGAVRPAPKPCVYKPKCMLIEFALSFCNLFNIIIINPSNTEPAKGSESMLIEFSLSF